MGEGNKKCLPFLNGSSLIPFLQCVAPPTILKSIHSLQFYLPFSNDTSPDPLVAPLTPFAPPTKLKSTHSL